MFLPWKNGWHILLPFFIIFFCPLFFGGLWKITRNLQQWYLTYWYVHIMYIHIFIMYILQYHTQTTETFKTKLHPESSKKIEVPFLETPLLYLFIVIIVAFTICAAAVLNPSSNGPGVFSPTVPRSAGTNSQIEKKTQDRSAKGDVLPHACRRSCGFSGWSVLTL